jgi:hypothetical protein
MSDINVVDSHVNGAPGETNGVAEPTPAELLAQKHSAQTESHAPLVEEVVDEEDLKHGAAATEENEAAPVKKQKAAKLDISSDEAFPSLGPAKTAPKVAVPSWSRNPTTLSASSFPAPAKGLSNLHERAIELTPEQRISEKDLDGKSFGAVLKNIKDRTGVKVEQQKLTATGVTRIILKGKKESVDKAEHAIRSELTKKVSLLFIGLWRGF